MQREYPQTMTCLDRDEIKAPLAVPLRSTAQGERDYATLLFLYNSGARASEVAALTVADSIATLALCTFSAKATRFERVRCGVSTSTPALETGNLSMVIGGLEGVS